MFECNSEIHTNSPYGVVFATPQVQTLDTGVKLLLMRPINVLIHH